MCFWEQFEIYDIYKIFIQIKKPQILSNRLD